MCCPARSRGLVSAADGATPTSGAHKAVNHVLVDIDGTLMDAACTPFPRAVQALEALRRSGVGLRFVTNNSLIGAAGLARSLSKAGFVVEPSEIFGSLAAARSLVEREQLRPMLILGTDALEDFAGLPQDEPNAVVIGMAPEELHYRRLTEAMRVLLKEDSRLIAVNKSRYFLGSDGMLMGTGAFVAGLEFSTGKHATVVGKPSREFFHAAAQHAGGAGVDVGSCVMIGDDAIDDVQGATDAGLQAVLVRTGKYLDGDERRCRVLPQVATNFAEAAEALLPRIVRPVE